ncbi:MAG: hypothetical protein KIT84_18015 [Labilithrix sp.]|nr:hypothetical protein [Labilithrix sp.]MCW5812929.1 hypothetical protein [Labilithrix sp.]
MTRLSVLLPLSVLLVACGHTETHQAMFRAPEPPTGRPVELYLADQPLPTRPYYEIALVQAIGFGSEAHPDDVAQALTEKAAKLGCDAVVRTFLDQGYSRANAAGVCVKWVGPPQAAGAAPAGALPRDNTAPRPSTPLVPAPSPRIEPLPSNPSQGR